MSNLTNPFDAILAQAAATRPTAEIAAKAQRINCKGSDKVLLLDCSGSMGEFVGGRRKVDILEAALMQIDLHAWRVIAFSDRALETKVIPVPSGSTDMAQAIDLAIAVSRPRQTLVISDGLPDSEVAALASANRLSGTISTLYVGSDRDKKAIEFMARLARLGCGKAHAQNLELGHKQLAEAVKMLKGAQ